MATEECGYATGFRDTLGALANPKAFTGAIDLAQVESGWAVSKLREMIRIRVAEEFVGELSESGEARCPCHLGIGQEAVAVGVSAHLKSSDRVFGAHRSHSHYLALGGGLTELFGEVLGKEIGSSKGMGGSMHLYGPEVGFHGSVPIVGATIPIATGAGLACKMDGAGGIAVSYFGDGAAEEGLLHESLNMASILKLPVIFVCENNLFSSHLDIHLRQPQNTIARFATAHAMPSHTVDGNDVVAVARATEQLVARARKGEGPGFLEAVTYRWRGHVGAKEDIDVGVRRHPEELVAWKHRDPVRRLADSLIARGAMAVDGVAKITEEMSADCTEAIDRARKAPYPPVSNLLDFVYQRGGK
ncbi:thiamine pyrophosphate-dependent dehydrogenase E1 component subunit alpha [Bradyrhizobium sediminis]|uniref:Thiamine pyrophosphate-dependent dehydrogenase E1 component subunit alpha n=1 Tax=Bradyrhizobium sediminis TaxID=2840469 RepID=A0A975NHZ3_9BRAD|nr:thiamine pyrophosphate-dependent dehydrogenase E1 component subunit alpha [Bradyrhizobium sediminis]QWG14886.1 thiamine pyrophosphate-dependent dehydrogenase E1 component subunit alpha [Bradyrhizobium sediminis]